MANIPAHLKRNPSASHVKAWQNYRLRKGRPKAALPSSRNQKLSEERTLELLNDFENKSSDHSRTRGKLRLWGEIGRQDGLRTTMAGRYAHIIAREILKDFKRTKGLKVLGIGVGYGGILAFLKYFMKAKVRGIEFGDLSDFNRGRKLGIKYNTDAADFKVSEMGKFDVTYSNFVFDKDIMHFVQGLQIFRNIAYLTRNGGLSYHIMEKEFFDAIKDKILAAGFEIKEINELEESMGYGVYTLKKIKED